MTRADDLERLLDEAREASPAERLPTYRDAIAAFGEEAIEPLATWLEEPAFAAFAIRTLGRIAVTHPEARAAVVAVMATTDRLTMPDHIARDDVLARVARMRAGEFTATPGEPCTWCDFRAMCPERA